jgi:polyhydroxyalkanoate synthase
MVTQQHPGLTDQLRRETRLTFDRARQSIDVVLGRKEPDVGLTPKDTIYERGTLKLYRYRPVTDEVYRVPIIFVMSLISKPYILDLVPGQSFVEYLINQGYDVYMIDWGVPRPEDHVLKLEDYVLDRIPRCVDEVRRITKQEEHSMLGYCMGGIFGLMYGAAFPDRGLKNLITVATPVDFNGMGLIRHWADPRWFDVDKVVDAFGNIPPEAVMLSLEMLRPFDRLTGYIRLWDNLWDPEYVRNWRVRYKWVNDQIPFPGECYRQVTKELLWANKLVTGDLTLGSKRVDLKNITASVLNAMAEHDHIAPYDSTKSLLSLVGTCDKQEMHVKGGHVSLISGKSAILRLWPTVNQWLAPRSM